MKIVSYFNMRWKFPFNHTQCAFTMMHIRNVLIIWLELIDVIITARSLYQEL